MVSEHDMGCKIASWQEGTLKSIVIVQFIYYVLNVTPMVFHSLDYYNCFKWTISLVSYNFVLLLQNAHNFQLFCRIKAAMDQWFKPRMPAHFFASGCPVSI